ncbi:hypothetical protein D3C87_1635680 [compost metagenome]
MEGGAIGHLTECFGRLVILPLRQPRFAYAHPQQNRVLTAAEETEESDFRFAEFTAVEGQIGQPELCAKVIGRGCQHLGKGDVGGRLLARLVKFETLFVDEAYAARVELATEIVARAGAEQRATELVLLRAEEIFVRLVASQEIISLETLFDRPADAVSVQHEAG